jgi:tetratricopeptide (TPR) repeat protein
VGPARAALVGGLQLPLGAVERTLREAGVTPDLLLDVALSGLELFRDGDPASGLRVRLRFAFAPGEPATALYLVREGGALRLLASDAAWPILAAEARRYADARDLAGAGRWLAWAREAVPGSAGDAGAPAGVLAAIAPPGAPLDAGRARLAAAALAAFADGSAPVVDVLSEASATDPAARRAILVALAQAHRSGDRPEAALAAADALLADDPASREAFVTKAWALRRLRRGAELDRAAEALLAHRPDDANVLALLATSRLLLGDRDGAARAFRRLVEGGRATPGVYNDAAWLSLFRGGASAEALGWARRAVDGAPREHAALNTLATVLAELDRAAEAREVFLRSIEDGGPLEGADWYVHGRIVEAWKLPDAARAAYARVRPDLVDGVEDPSGAHVLARRRLAGLGEGGAAPKVGAPARPSVRSGEQ